MATKIVPPVAVQEFIEEAQQDVTPVVLAAAATSVLIAGYAFVQARKVRRIEKAYRKFQDEIEMFVDIQNQQIIINHDDIRCIARVLTDDE